MFKKSRFLKIVGTITIINIIARLFGFAREVIIGYQYGTTFQADSIITAFTLPYFFYIVLGGAVTTAFISIYSKLSANRRVIFAQSVFSYLIVAVGLLTALFMIFPNFWIGLIFPGLSEAALTLTSDLFIWTAPATFFLVVAIGMSGLHNVHENYHVSTFSTFIFNGMYLLLGVCLTPLVMEYSYAVGATVGSLCMFLFLIYYIRKQALVPLRMSFVKMEENRRFLKLLIPLLFGGATVQFYFIIQRIYAASLADGAIAAINYSSKMTQFPQSVLMLSVTTIIYPLITKAAGDGDYKRLSAVYKQGFRLMTLILIPASLFVFVYSKEIISFIFEYGNFSAESTNATYPLLQVFSLSIVSLALNTYITRFFYALENTLLPTILNLLSVFVINIAIIFLLIDQWGSIAIALGTVISSALNTLLLIFFSWKQFGLVVSSWSYLLKLMIYAILAYTVLSLLVRLPLGSFLALLTGGLATLFFIWIGLRKARAL